jgi:7-cyano-7-deazaguanine synthase
MKKAIILLSGGLDSTTVLAIAKNFGFETYALGFSYGQRHEIELESAKKVAQKLGVKEFKIAKIDLRIFGGSALTDEISVPKNSDFSESKKVPITYVPARNTIFLSYALAYAEVVGAFDIFIGVNAIDYSGYPDCRPEFIKTFQNLADLATAAGVENKGRFKIHAPLIEMSKKEIIQKGIEIGVDYSMTHSCYDPIVKDENTYSCGECDSCLLRKEGFRAAGVKDPLVYQK